VNSRSKKFLSYYKPYLGLFSADLACALIASATTLLLPLCVRHITKNVLAGITPNALNQIYLMGVVMLALVAIYALCNTFVDYQGHMMGALMESDMRRELFEHYQKLSFRFYDDQKTGQLMTRLTNDSFALSELFHHGPEDIVISLLNFAGAFIILVNINVELALIVSRPAPRARKCQPPALPDSNFRFALFCSMSFLPSPFTLERSSALLNGPFFSR
jgi:ATP-binding cassette subfamily B protein